MGISIEGREVLEGGPVLTAGCLLRALLPAHLALDESCATLLETSFELEVLLSSASGSGALLSSSSSCLSSSCRRAVVRWNEELPRDAELASLRLVGGLQGGKGGFGALLRGKKAKPKTDNSDDCRDLSTGRRLRDVQQQRALDDMLRRELEMRPDTAQHQQQRPQQQHRTQSSDDSSSTESRKRSRPEGDRDADERALKAQRTAQETRRLGEKLVESTQDAVAAGIAAKLMKKSGKPSTGSGQHLDQASDNESGSSSASSPSTAEHQSSSSSSGAVTSATPGSPSDNTSASSLGERSTARVITLESAESALALETLGLDGLKEALMSRGMKCGGTLEQRAERLFSVKGLAPGSIPHALLAPTRR